MQLLQRGSRRLNRDYLKARRREALESWQSQVGGLTFKEFVDKAFPSFRWYRYNTEVAECCQALADGKLRLPDGSRADKLFVHLRYQTGKSTIIALFCAYLMTRFKGIRILVTMHRQDQSEDFSRMVQAFYKAAGGKLRGFAVHSWQTEGPDEASRSRLYAVSKGSSPTGKPADVLVGDDMMKGAADSAHAGQFLKDKGWFKREFLSRKRVHPQPELGRLLSILINTRQGLSDIASYWLYLGNWYCLIMPTFYDPEQWPIEVAVGPFPAGDGDTTLPEDTTIAANCTIHPDWRKPGEALDESVPDLTAEAFHARRAINPGGYQSESDVAANEQGCPRPAAGGGILHRSWLAKVSPPAADHIVAIGRAWDLAATEGGGDWTASILFARLASGRFVVLHGCRARKDTVGVMQLLAAMAIVDGPRVLCGVPVGLAEGKITFQGISRDLKRILSDLGFPAPPLRAMPVRTTRRPDAFKSAKHFRFAGLGGSFAQAAQPPDWEWKDNSFSVGGSVDICQDYDPYSPSIEAIAGRSAEADAILALAKAACGKVPPELIEKLNVCAGPWWRVAAEEWHNYGGFDGGSDHYVDAAADGKTLVTATGPGRPWTG